MNKLEDLFTKEITKEDILKKIENEDKYMGIVLAKNINSREDLYQDEICEANITTFYKESEIKLWSFGNEVPDCLSLENYGKTYKLYTLNENVQILPCKIGDSLWTNFSMSGWYLREKDKPYQVRIVFIGLNGSDEMGEGFVNVLYEKNGNMMQFNFSDIGKNIFYTKEEALMVKG